MYALTVGKGDAAFIIRLNLPSRFSQSMRKEGGKGPANICGRYSRHG